LPKVLVSLGMVVVSSVALKCRNSNLTTWATASQMCEKYFTLSFTENLQ
jgi:hypothetical protein